MRTAWPYGSLAVLACAALGACAGPVELRQQVMAIDASWRISKMEGEDFERMREALVALGAQSPDDPNRIAGLPDVLRIALNNPSAFVRAEALRTSWKLGSDLPRPAWREDALDREAFNQKTSRLEELVASPEPPTDETLELARWLAQYRVPAKDLEHARLAVSIAEVVLSQGLWRQDALGTAFRDGLQGSAAHALDLVTLEASRDPYSVVREEALAHVELLPPELALRLLAELLGRETDSAVVLAALDGIGRLVGGIEPQTLRDLLAPLAASTDVAVRRRVQGLIERLP